MTAFGCVRLCCLEWFFVPVFCVWVLWGLVASTVWGVYCGISVVIWVGLSD